MSESRREIKTLFLGNQSGGPPFSFESIKWGVFFTHDSDKEIFLCLSRVGKLKHFTHAINLPVRRSPKTGVRFLHTIQTKKIFLCPNRVKN